MSELQVRNLHKTFESGPDPVEVLRGVDLDMKKGESLAVTGPSGSGKSTLLHLLGTLDTPTSGSIDIEGWNPFELPEPELARFRNRVIGFVFQDHHLLPQYSVVENVLIPTVAAGGGDASELRAKQLLEKVGLGHRLEHLPSELSGGERQRVAVARALINSPSLMLCDEPTGNLDAKTATTVADLLLELHREASNILIVVTHSQSLAERMERHCQLHEGVCSEV